MLIPTRRHYLRSRLELLNATPEHQRKIKQFAVEAVTDEVIWDALAAQPPLLDMLLKAGVWGGQRLGRLAQTLSQGRRFNVVVGLRPSNLHMGHLLLAQEVAWYARQGATIYVVAAETEHRVSNQDPVLLHQAVDRFVSLLRSLSGANAAAISVVSDADNPAIAEAEFAIEAIISPQKIFQLFGWDEHVSVLRLRSACLLAAAFLYPWFARQSPDLTLVTADINQLPFLELARMAAQKLKIQPPTVTYKALIPNIVGSGRMSIKHPKQALFLSDSPAELSSKLRKSVTGGCDLELQKVQGGDLGTCVFLDIISRFLDDDVLERTISACASGSTTCGNCKHQTIPLFLNDLAVAQGVAEPHI